MNRLFPSLIVLAMIAACASLGAAELERVKVAPDGRGFLLADSARPFAPWGLNYDHDRAGRLIEDYWLEEWPTVEADFAEMRSLGANLVRVHLQLGKFMRSADQPSEESLRQLARLLRLAEATGLYLDLTGLGCYHKADVPAWYDALTEMERWAVQAQFWEAIARTCAESRAVFCYDLMNEPVVPGAGSSREDWLGPAFGDKHFVQFIARDLAGRSRVDVARQWIAMLKTAIRKEDGRSLITVGLVPWSLDRPGLTSGFVPSEIAGELGFLAVHVYPEAARPEDAAEILRGFMKVGKPVVVEEIFPLKCSTANLEQFIDQQPDVAGWIGFYWGQSAAECRASKTIAGAMTADWLDYFKRHGDREDSGK